MALAAYLRKGKTLGHLARGDLTLRDGRLHSF